MDKKVERTQPTLSIIVPVYNVEKYLPKCIESILAQSFTDFEVILIDDGATDKSGEICEEYANKDTRIKIIHKENGGLSSARNAGIELSNGNYIGFVDSDDFIHPQMYEILLREARSSNSDVVICRYKCWNEGEEQGQIIQQDINQYEIKDMDTEEALRQLLRGELYRHGVCNKLFRSEVIKELKFPIGKIYEDNFFTYKALAKAKKIRYINQQLYYYLQRQESIIHKKITLKSLDIFNAGEEIMHFIDINYPRLREDAEYAYAIRFFDLIPDLVQQQGSNIIQKELQRHINKYNKRLKSNTLVSSRQKGLLKIYGSSIGLYRVINKILVTVQSPL